MKQIVSLCNYAFGWLICSSCYICLCFLHFLYNNNHIIVIIIFFPFILFNRFILLFGESFNFILCSYLMFIFLAAI